MQAEHLEAFRNAASRVLQTMAFTEVAAGKPYIKEDGTSTGDVSAVVGITGPMAGSMSLSFNEASILFVVSNMFGEEMKEVDEEVADAVGELTNIISGDARREMAENGLTLDGAVPTVIMGKGHRVRHMSNAPVFVLPFETPGGPFFVEVCLAPGA